MYIENKYLFEELDSPYNQYLEQHIGNVQKGYEWLKEKKVDITLEKVREALMVDKDCRDLNEYLEKFENGEISEAEARHLSSGSYDPYGRGHHCEYNRSGQKGYWDDDDRWHTVIDDD